MIGNVNVPGALAADIANKVDKVIGKGLSTNDFTDAYKTQLDNMSQSGGSKSTIVCSMTQPQDLKNGLWIKTDSEKDIRIIPPKENLYKEKMEWMTAHKIFNAYGMRCETVNGKIYVFCDIDIFCYDPETKEWITMNSKLYYNSDDNNAKVLYNRVCSCVINNKIYLFGGYSYGARTVQCYDPETDTIDYYLNKLNIGAMYNCCCAINGKAYIFGGYNKDNGYGTNSIQCYDPETNTCTNMSATCPDYMTAEMTCCVYNNKAYIFGGWMVGKGQNISTDRAFCYDPAVDKVTTIASLYYNSSDNIRNSRYAISSFLWNNKIYLFGGCYYDSPTEYNSNYGKYYDPETNTYIDSGLCIPISIPPDNNQQTLSSSCHCIVNDKLYIFGGLIEYHNRSSGSAHNYNNYGYIYDLNTLLPMGSLPFKIDYSYGNYCSMGDNIYILDYKLGTDVWYYNTTTNTLYKKENQLLVAPITYTNKCSLNNKIYFMGGSSSPYKLYCYDPINETCEELCQMPNAVDDSIIGVNNEILIFDFTKYKVYSYNILTKNLTEKYYSNNNKLFTNITIGNNDLSAFVYCNKVYFSCVKLTTNTGNNTSVNSQAIAIYNTETNSMDYQIIGDYSKMWLSSSACRIYNKIYIFANTMKCQTSSSNSYIYAYCIFSYNLENGEFNQLPDFTTTVKDDFKSGTVVCCAVGESIYLFGGDNNAIQKLTVTPSNDSMKNSINIITTNLDMNSVALRSPQEGVYEYKNILNVVDVDGNMNATNLEFHPIENYQVIDQES